MWHGKFLVVLSFFFFVTAAAVAEDSLEVQQIIDFGKILEGQGLVEGAIEEYGRALEVAPDSARALMHRAYAYLKTGQADQSIADFSEAIRLDPKISGYHIGRALGYALGNDFNLAMFDIRRAIELDPGNYYAYWTRGHIYSRQGDWAKAIPEFSHAISLDPVNPAAYEYRAIAYRAIGSQDLAAKDEAEYERLSQNSAVDRLEVDPGSVNQEAGAENSSFNESAAEKTRNYAPPAFTVFILILVVVIGYIIRRLHVWAGKSAGESALPTVQQVNFSAGENNPMSSKAESARAVDVKLSESEKGLSAAQVNELADIISKEVPTDVETAFRQAWLEVTIRSKGLSLEKERTLAVALGVRPVLFGCAGLVDVRLAEMVGAKAHFAKVSLLGGKVTLHDLTTGKTREVAVDEGFDVSNAHIVVRSKPAAVPA